MESQVCGDLVSYSSYLPCQLQQGPNRRPNNLHGVMMSVTRVTSQARDSPYPSQARTPPTRERSSPLMLGWRGIARANSAQMGCLVGICPRSFPTSRQLVQHTRDVRQRVAGAGVAFPRLFCGAFVRLPRRAAKAIHLNGHGATNLSKRGLAFGRWK